MKLVFNCFGTTCILAEVTLFSHISTTWFAWSGFELKFNGQIMAGLRVRIRRPHDGNTHPTQAVLKDISLSLTASILLLICPSYLSLSAFVVVNSHLSSSLGNV